MASRPWFGVQKRPYFPVPLTLLRDGRVALPYPCYTHFGHNLSTSRVELEL